MEQLKVYQRSRGKIELESILVTDENVYEMNAVMKLSKYRQFIVNELVMMRVLEEYFIKQEYELLEFIVRDEANEKRLKSYVEEIKSNRVLFYKLWSWNDDFDYIDKIVLCKGEDIFEMNSSGRYTDSESHKKTVHKVILEFLNERN